MFEPFSSGYYLGRLFVEPTSSGTALLHRTQHATVNEQLYADGSGIERHDHPLVMKLGTRHFSVEAGGSVPEGTLAVPEELLNDSQIDNPPELREVFLAKAEHAKRLVEYGAV